MFNKDIQSDEEEYASWFFEELKQRGYIKEVIYQPNEFVLAEAVKYGWTKPKPTKKEPHRFENKEANLLEAVIYTPDVLVYWDEKANGVFYNIGVPRSPKCPLFIAHYDTGFIDNRPISYFEVKPIFDDNNMTREVVIRHKWVYQQYGIYVNMFIRDKVMPKLFTPTRYITTQVYQKTHHNKKTGHTHLPGTSKIKWNVRTLDEYLNSVK